MEIFKTVWSDIVNLSLNFSDQIFTFYFESEKFIRALVELFKLL